MKRICPKCGSEEFFDGSFLPETFFICCRCGALVQNNPFRIEIILDDARERFSEAKNYNVEGWKIECK